MCHEYWITRNSITRQVNLHCVDDALENLNAFLAMCRRSCLLEAVAALRADPQGTYHSYPGEYLELSAQNGRVEAAIVLFGDRAEAHLPVPLFIRIATEYVDALNQMCR